MPDKTDTTTPRARRARRKATEESTVTDAPTTTADETAAAADETAEYRIAAQEANAADGDTADDTTADGDAAPADGWEYAQAEGATDDANATEGDPEAEAAAETPAAAEPDEATAATEATAEQNGRTPRAGATDAATVARILELRDEGNSFGAIAEKLMEEGLRPQRAPAWRGQTVRAIVVRERGADNVGEATGRRRAGRTVWVIPTPKGVEVFADEATADAWLAQQTGSLPAPVQVPVQTAAAESA